MNCKNSAQNALKVAIFRLKIGLWLSALDLAPTPRLQILDPPLHTSPDVYRFKSFRRSVCDFHVGDDLYIIDR